MQTIIEKHYKFNYRTLVKRVKYQTGNNEHDAEDVVQEAYARALKYKHTFELGLPFNHWFGRIVSNALKDWKREQFNSSITDEFDERDVEPLPETSVKDALVKKIQLEINELEDESQKEALKLHLIYGFKLREVVQITNLKYQAVDKLIQRFKNKLKEKHM